MAIRTREAFVITLSVLTAGFIYSSYRPAPYAEFAAAVVAVFGAYGYKRLMQRRGEYQPNGNGNDNGHGKEIPSDRPSVTMVMEKPMPDNSYTRTDKPRGITTT